MFTAVFSICLLADPKACDLQAAALPLQASFSDCLAEAGDEAALYSRQHRDAKITRIYCMPRQPGQGR